MTSGIGYALAAMICYGLADFVYKRAAGAGVLTHRFLMVQAWCFAPTVTLYGILTGTLELHASALWGALAGLFVFVGVYNFARALRTGAVSINAPVFRLNFTITAAMAIVLLGEPLTAYKLVGLVLALVAVWLLLGGSAEAGKKISYRALGSSLARVLVATVAMGIANFVHKLGLIGGSSPAMMVVAQASAFFPLVTAFAYLVDRRFILAKSTWAYGATAAFLLAIAFLSLLEGLARGQASVLVPISQMGFVVTAMLGVALLHEPFPPRKAIGLAVAVAALACLAQS